MTINDYLLVKGTYTLDALVDCATLGGSAVGLTTERPTSTLV